MNNFSLINLLVGRDEFSYLVPLIDKNSLFAFALTYKASYKEVLKLKEPIKTTYTSIASSVDLIEWAMDMGCPSQNSIWGEAAGKDGNLNILKWIFNNTTLNDCYAAALGGHLSCVYEYAAEGGHIHVLEWALGKNIRVGYGDDFDFSEVIKVAAENGHYDVLNFLRKNGFKWNSETCAGAAYGGHLDVLKLLRAEGCEWGQWVYYHAAEGGHLDIIKWAYENGLSIQEHSDLCGHAAKGGHFEILKWARANGFPWGQYVMWWAALYNKLDILKWAHANGCVCNKTRSNRLMGSSVEVKVILWVEKNLGRS